MRCSYLHYQSIDATRVPALVSFYRVFWEGGEHVEKSIGRVKYLTGAFSIMNTANRQDNKHQKEYLSILKRRTSSST